MWGLSCFEQKSGHLWLDETQTNEYTSYRTVVQRSVVSPFSRTISSVNKQSVLWNSRKDDRVGKQLKVYHPRNPLTNSRKNSCPETWRWSTPVHNWGFQRALPLLNTAPLILYARVTLFLSEVTCTTMTKVSATTIHEAGSTEMSMHFEENMPRLNEVPAKI